MVTDRTAAKESITQRSKQMVIASQPAASSRKLKSPQAGDDDAVAHRRRQVQAGAQVVQDLDQRNTVWISYTVQGDHGGWVDFKGGSWVKFERRGIHGRRLSRQGSALLK